jgi:hypothetical protein
LTYQNKTIRRFPDKKLKFIQMKIFTFTTYNFFKEEIGVYNIEALNVKEARKYAKVVIANSRDNEISHSRVVLLKK